MNNDELMQLAEMFDAIVNSDNPAVQRSLQYTAVLAKLAEEKQNIEGPFLKMFRMVDELRGEMQSLRRSVQILENNSRPYGGDYSTDYSTSIVDLNMNTGMAALTTAQITALTGVDTVTLRTGLQPISVSDLTAVFSNYTNDDRIKF
jgi:hypothetical protein